MAYLLSLIRTIVPPHVSIFSPDVCLQKLLEIVHREEVKVNWILSAKVEFLNSEKGPRDRYKLPGTPFKKGKINARAECGGIQRTWFFTKICCVNVTEYQSTTRVFKVNYFICVPSIVTN